MIKSRIVQTIYLTAYLTLGVIAIFASFGLFQAKYDAGFYVFFTNLANYFCFGIVLAELIFVLKKLKANQDGAITVAPLLKYIGIILIVITFCIYNFVLAPDRTAEVNLSIRSVLLHVVLPVMYVAGWFMFSERKKVKWFWPFITLITAAVYIAYVYLRAWILGGVGAKIYPYFFLDPNQVGIMGIFKWIGILLAIFIALGFVFYFLNHVKKPKKDEKE